MEVQYFSSHHTTSFLNEVFFPIKVTPFDRFAFYFVAGFLFGTYQSADGMTQVEVVRYFKTPPDMKPEDASFGQFQSFDKKKLSKEERNHLIGQLVEGGVPQERIARYFEISQSSVSGIARKVLGEQE